MRAIDHMDEGQHEILRVKGMLGSKYREVKAIMESSSPKATEDKPLPCEARRAKQGDPVLEVRKHLMRSANLYLLCVKAADKVIAPHVPEIARTSEMFQSMTASLFIHATRWRLDEK